MTAAPIECPISTGGDGRPEATRETSAAKSSRPVTNIVSRPPRRAVAAQRQRVRRVPFRREPRQEIRRPAPRIAVAAVNEQQRRLAAVAVARTRRQARADFEIATRRGACVGCVAAASVRRDGSRRARLSRHDAPTTFCQSPRAIARLRRRLPPLPAARDVPRRVREANPGYFCRPVPPFGASDARLVIVGLAPGHARRQRDGPAVHRRLRRHPAVRDAARLRLRVASRTASRRDDGLELIDCRITNAVKCLPPDNKPAPAEIRNCNAYLAPDLASVPAGGAILALGRIAHDATLRALGMKRSSLTFAHGARHDASARSRAFRQLSLQPLQHQHGTADRADVPRGLRRHRRASGREGARRAA